MLTRSRALAAHVSGGSWAKPPRHPTRHDEDQRRHSTKEAYPGDGRFRITQRPLGERPRAGEEFYRDTRGHSTGPCNGPADWPGGRDTRAEQEDAAECRAQPNCRGIEVGATVVSELCVPRARSTAFAIAHNARTKKNAAPRTRTTRIEIPLLTRRSRPNPRLSAKRSRSSPRLARSFIAAPLDTSRVTIRPAAAATGCLTGYPTRGTRHG